jgi:glycosyltransferase involved in cell wall biosynthesis
LEDQVRVLNKRVDVNQVLSRVHASVALATDPAVIHPYPHSLIESLAAGKPVLLSHSIPMADDVTAHGCGVVIADVTPQAILSAVGALAARYDRLSQAACRIETKEWNRERLLASYRQMYDCVLAHARHGE